MADPVVAGRFSRRRFLHWFGRAQVIALVTILLVGFGVWVVYASSWLGVKSVDVDGTSYLTPREVERVADVPIGTPLARLDLNAVEDRVAELPAVASVDVERDWPDGVHIVIQERTAIAVVKQDHKLHGMDADGVLYRTYRHRPDRLPLVRAGQLDDKGSADALHEVAGVIASLDRHIARKVDHVEVASMDAIELVLSNGKQVQWGSAAQSDLKARVLAALLKVNASVYDVSVPEQPTTRA
ncbi:MAG TPA: FtsQ-type POTRA domain-containing protein [Nocardioidaceae bacterium]|nr:FtsQ-type POTRA domain-containing protein [Nocardioidaceae bacterium]